MTNTTYATVGSERNTHGVVVRLLQTPHQGETDHNHTHNDAINNEDLQAVGLKITNQPGNGDVSDNRRNQHSDEKGCCDTPAGSHLLPKTSCVISSAAPA